MRVSQPSQGANPRFWVAAFTLLIAAASTPAPGASSTAAPERQLFEGLSVADVPLQQYRAFRRMHALAERANHEGWLDAWTEFDAKGFRYHIVHERGSGTVRNRVLKAVLKREQELIANGDFGRGDLTPENYTFGPEITGDGVRYIPITPKRKDVMLVDGRMVLARDGELLRVEGVLAKNPSFWTTRVDVVRQYSRLDGIRVPISISSIAKVRFVGTSRLDITYEYESINHRPVSTAAALQWRRPGGTAASSAGR